jgi:hypothetical protein
LAAALPRGFQAARRGGAVWAVAATGELSRARELAVAHAADLLEAGATFMAGWVLQDAARLGAGAAVAERLTGLVGQAQSALLRAMAANAVALAADDADGLDAPADGVRR